MDRTPQDVTEAELTILQFLWDQGPATIRQLTDALYPPGTEAQYATVQKLLERLEGKGHVSRDVGRDSLMLMSVGVDSGWDGSGLTCA